MKEITVNNEVYVSKDDFQKTSDCHEINTGRYVIVRTYSAGVFAGYLYNKNGKEVVLKNSRNIWKWAGASTLSQLAMSGTSDPENCKFPCVVDHIELTEVIQILNCTDVARKSIEGVSVWTC